MQIPQNQQSVLSNFISFFRDKLSFSQHKISILGICIFASLTVYFLTVIYKRSLKNIPIKNKTNSNLESVDEKILAKFKTEFANFKGVVNKSQEDITNAKNEIVSAKSVSLNYRHKI